MKKMIRVVVAAAVAAVLGISSTMAMADDGIAASPKVRAQMNDRAKTSGAVDKDLRTAGLSTAASPKVVAEREALTKAGAGVAIASTTVSAKDGIAASPKVRQQLNDRAGAIEIAPIK
jgi:hypothetical protein